MADQPFRRLVYPDGRIHDIKPIIDVTHAYIHVGIVSYVNHTNKSVSNGAAMDVALTVPAGYELHATFSISSTGLAYVSLFQGPTFTGGTPVPAYAMKRASEIPPVYTVVHTPTVTATGTAIINERMIPGGSTPASRLGSAVRDQTEWVLSGGTNFLFRVTNASGQAQPLAFEAIIYHKEE